MQKILFFPGGPGLNGNPERSLLTDDFHKSDLQLLCWDEPSAMRPQGHPFNGHNSFENYLQAAEQFLLQHYQQGSPLTILAHCFGNHPALHLVKKHPEKINLLVIITPDLCLSKTDLNIFANVMADYQLHDPEKAAKLRQILDRRPDKFDEDIQSGWQMAAENPRLFNSYWKSEQLRDGFLKFYTGQYGIDPVSFFNIRKSWAPIELPPTSIPVLILYGRHDSIISLQDELAKLPEYYADFRVIEMAGSAHYPHIEEKDKVIQLIKQALINRVQSLDYQDQA